MLHRRKKSVSGAHNSQTHHWMPGHHRGCSRCWRPWGPRSSCSRGETNTKSLWRKGDKGASGWGQRLLHRAISEGLFDTVFDTWNSRQGRSQCSRQLKIQEWAWHTQGTERLHEPEFRKQAGKEDEVVEAGGAELRRGPSSPQSSLDFILHVMGNQWKSLRLHVMFWRFVFKESWWLLYGEWKWELRHILQGPLEIGNKTVFLPARVRFPGRGSQLSADSQTNPLSPKKQWHVLLVGHQLTTPECCKQTLHVILICGVIRAKKCLSNPQD